MDWYHKLVGSRVNGTFHLGYQRRREKQVTYRKGKESKMKMENREKKIAQRDEESLSGEYSRIINLEMRTEVKRPYVPQIQILATSF
jgi:hypothetical protein